MQSPYHSGERRKSMCDGFHMMNRDWKKERNQDLGDQLGAIAVVQLIDNNNNKDSS